MTTQNLTVRTLRDGGGFDITFGTAATTSPAIPAGTSFARFLATTDCYIEIGAAATASAGTGAYLSAFTPEYFGVLAGSGISVVSVSGTGILNVKPCRDQGT